MFVARVTADIDALQQFMEWGGIADHLADAGHRRARLDALLRVAAGARDLHPDRAAPADRLVDASEADGRVQHGAHPGRRDAVRGVGVGDGRGRRARLRARRAHRGDGRARGGPALPRRDGGPLRAATLWPLSSVFYALSLSTVVVLGAFYGPRWGMSFGQVTAFLFLAECSCTCSPTCRRSTRRRRTRSRRGARSWRSTTWRSRSSSRSTASSCRAGPSVQADDVRFSYREGPEVLHGISLSVPAGGRVAIVGETGCGKSTFVKVTSRLADPTDGTMLIDGVDLRRVAPDTRRSGSGWCRRTASCSTRPCARTSGWGGRARPTATSRPRSRSWARRLGGDDARGARDPRR